MSATLDDISRRLDELLTLVRQPVPVAPPSFTCESTGIDGARLMLGTHSRSATYRALKAAGVHAWAPGKYRVKEIQNAIARRTAQAAQRAQQSTA